MDAAVRDALSRGGVIDITTTGRRTGQPRRIEIAFHNVAARLYISGRPRPKKRDWLANLEAHPRFTFHLKREVVADLPSVARPVTDEAERREVLAQVAQNWGGADVEATVRHSPLVEVTIAEA